MRCKGAMLIGEAIVSLQAPGFLHSRDKLALFTSRISVSRCISLKWLLILYRDHLLCILNVIDQAAVLTCIIAFVTLSAFSS